MAKLFTLHAETLVYAPIDRCFLLSTSVEIVRCELHMRPVRGRTSGLVKEGDTVRWEGWKFGLPQVHESLIEAYQPYVFFRDRMIAGRFRSFEHDHAFRLEPDGSVRLIDDLRFTMRWGWFGTLLGRLLLVPDIRGLMRRRFALLKRIAESDEWRKFLPPSQPGTSY